LNHQNQEQKFLKKKLKEKGFEEKFQTNLRKSYTQKFEQNIFKKLKKEFLKKNFGQT
jgi:hypothetical protein